MKHISVMITAMAVLGLSACTTTGNVEKNTAIGATGGAIAGAIIGNNVGDGDAKTGAIIGGIVGAAGGAYSGHQEDKRMGEDTRLRQSADGQQLFYDAEAGKYYFVDQQTGNTYWQNGALRSQAYN